MTKLLDQQNVTDLEEDFVNVRVDISQYANQEVYFAFRYTSSGSVAQKSLEARVDNFRIRK